MRLFLIIPIIICFILFCNLYAKDNPYDIYWSGLGEGMNNKVYALTIFDGKLIAGGAFTQANGITANYIAAWDGTTWSPLANGMNGRVFSLEVYEDKLIAGGEFTQAGGVAANQVAAWDGVSWSALGQGLASYVQDFAIYDNKLIACGYFASTGGGQIVNHIAAWNGSTWEPVGNGVNEWASTLTLYDDHLIIGGRFDSAGNVVAYNVAKWDGTEWSPLGTGPGYSVYALEVFNSNLIAGGTFPQGVRAWNGSSWSGLSIGTDNNVVSMAIYNGQLIAGGDFVMAGGDPANRIATWNGNNWASLGSGIENSTVWDMAVDDTILYAGGEFRTAGGDTTNYIGMWIRDQFREIKNLNDSGPNSFRSTIDLANAQPGIDSISFEISGTINIQSTLPNINDDSTIILGSSAPGGAHSIILDGGDVKSAGSGLSILSSNNLIEGLTIRNFTGNGIEVLSGSGNRISNNLIYDNGLMGIDLNDDGVTANDVGDGDSGPNDLLNFPEVDSVFMNPDSSFIVYGHAGTGNHVELFISHTAGDTTQAVDPSGHGEAFAFVDSLTADAGDGSFVFNIPNTYPYFSVLTMTATDANGNTSEFSENFPLVPAPLIIVAYSPVNMIVTDPEGFVIGKDRFGSLIQTLFPASYTEIINDSVHIDYPIDGTYNIEVITEDGAAPGSTYSIGVRIDGSLQTMIVVGEDVPEYEEADSYDYNVEEDYHYENADSNGDETINLLDITFIISFLYKEGPEPVPYHSADANCDYTVNLLDITYLISYLYKEGEEPCLIDEFGK